LTSDREDNPVGKFLSKKGEGVLLVSVQTDDIKKDQALLTEKDIQFMMPDSYKGPYGQVNFIPAKTLRGIQVELFELAGKFKR